MTTLFNKALRLSYTGRLRALLLLTMLVCSFGVLFSQDLEQIGKKGGLNANGSLSLLGGPYFFSGNGLARNDPFFWNANGNITFSVYGWQFPFSVSVGSQQRNFSQPFNRYGVSPHYKWVKIHAGYRSMRFNQYTLGGLQFLGGGIELDPKGFRFAAFYGRFNKPVAQDTLASIRPIPAFKRIGYGAKVGVGSSRNHVDLMIVHVHDDANSIPDPVQLRTRPMENLTAGLSGQISITKKLSWSFDSGLSAITEDTRLPEYDDIKLPALGFDLFTPRFGSRAALAANTGFQWTSRFVTLKLNGKQIDPGYRSLATTYQQSDVRAITFEPSVRWNKNKWRIQGSIGRQEDNVRNTKSTQSVRTIGSAALAWNPTRNYGVDLNFSNYGIQQERGLQALNDTFRVALSNRSYGISQHLVRANSERVWNASLVAGLQELVDLNPYGSFGNSENQVIYGNLFIGRVRSRDGFGLNGGLNYSRNKGAYAASVLVGPSLGTSMQLVKKKLMTTTTVSYNKAFQDSKAAGSTVNLSASMQYKLSNNHSFQISTYVLHNKTSILTSRQFTETRIQAGYVLYIRSKT